MDYYYFILIVPVLILSLGAQLRIDSVYRRYFAVANMRGLTGEAAARQVLSRSGVRNVRIEHISGRLSDHFDPRENVIRLSDGVYGGCSVAAVGVACHEAGHAVQHAEGYGPIKVRNALLKPCLIGSRAALPLALLGLFLRSTPLMNAGIFFYVFVMLFQLATLPVEFNASRRAVDAISDTGMLAEDERRGAEKVLRAAAMTYVAAFAASAANLLRLLLLSRNRRN